MQFIPTILTDQLAEYEQLYAYLVGRISRIQVDIADETLVDNETLLPGVLPRVDPGVEIDAHLMVDLPSQYLNQLKLYGAHRVLVHYELVEPVDEVIERAQDLGFGVALVINPETAVDAVAPYADKIEFLQIMGIHPGHGGQPLLETTYDRVREAKKLFPHLPIAVDGGVRLHNAKELTNAGVDLFVVGKGGYLAEDDSEDLIARWKDVLNINN